MNYGIIMLLFFALFLSILFSYLFADKWMLVGKDDSATLCEMDSINARFFQELDQNPISIEDCTITLKVKNGKVACVTTENQRTFKSLSFDEKDNPQKTTTNKSWSLLGARIFVGVTLFILFCVIFFFLAMTNILIF